MKIAIYCDDEWERNILTNKLTKHELLFLSEGAVADTAEKDDTIECLCVFIKTPVNASMIDCYPNLKGVVTRSTGFDHIDVTATQKRNIPVSNVPAYGENTIAEYAFALLLTLTRQIYDTYARVRVEGTFTTEGLAGMDLRGRKMGIVGTGHTGQYAIRIARGFGMDVIASDVHERKELEGELDFMYVTYEDLLAQSDVLSFHAPYNTHTHHMLNSENIMQVKKGAYIINTARGGLIETRALVCALENDHIKGAGLDVVEEEGSMANIEKLIESDTPNASQLQTVLANQYLIDHPNVLIMPHNAFNTIEARERILQTTVDNIEAIVNSMPINTVTT